MATVTGTEVVFAPGSAGAAVASALKAWWASEATDWDAAVAGSSPAALPGGSDLWDNMPTVDSKAVARTSPIFERLLGVRLDVKLIRPGGYATIDDVIADLVPKMTTAVAQTLSNKAQKG